MKKLIPMFLLIPIFGQSPLHYNISVPKDMSKKPATLFLMHGYGGNENGYMNLKERLKDDVVIVSMRAPFKMKRSLFTIFQNSNKWYDFSIINGDTSSNQAQINESTDRILATIEEVKEKYAINNERIIIGGFSQGAIMSYKLGLLYPALFSGVMVHSGRLPVEYTLLSDLNEYNDLNILIVHGKKDGVLSTKWSLQGKKLFEDINATTEYLEIDAGHSMNSASIEKIIEWIAVR